MPVLNNGVFSFEIPTSDLAKGLRPSRRSPRNAKFLTKCRGAVGLDGVLQVLDDINEDLLNTVAIVDGFPYPQLFVFTNVIIVCGKTRIYEWVAGSLVAKLGPVTSGIEWSMVDLYDYIYGSNGQVAVRRRAEDHVWEVTTSLPVASAICNFNGQILIGAPDVLRP